MDSKGFTLIEILVALAVTGIVMAGLVTAFSGQQDAHLAQTQVVEMQQNLRTALYIMTRQIRMAGYDPNGEVDAAIISAGDGSDSANQLAFSYYVSDGPTDGADNDDDGTGDEADEYLQIMAYYKYNSTTLGSDTMGQKTGAANVQAIAESIQSVTFAYRDGNGNLLTPLPLSGTDLEDIRSIQITLVAAPDSAQTDYTGGKTRTLTTTVLCRNMGI